MKKELSDMNNLELRQYLSEHRHKFKKSPEQMKEQYDFSKGKRGAIDPIPQGKTQVTLCLDDEIIDWFREAVNATNGGNYQTLINEVLRDYIDHKNESLEALLRRVLREELANKQ